MTQRLSCPQCGGHEIEPTRYAFFHGTSSSRLMEHCHCRSCGAECDDLARRAAFSARVNIIMGFAIICLAMLTAFSVLY